MAGDWIKMRIDLMEDPAVIEMASKLGCREETVVGYCHKFWSWVSRQCNGGSVTGVNLQALGRVLNLPGFPELLIESGWLEFDDSGEKPVLTIPKFERHLSESAKKRALTAERVREHRRADAEKVKRKCNAATVTSPLPEKRREDKKRKPPLSPCETQGEKDVEKHKELPFELQQFADAWGSWTRYRASIRKPLSEETEARQLAWCEARGAARAVAAIEWTIRAGYVRLQEPRPEANGEYTPEVGGGW